MIGWPRQRFIFFMIWYWKLVPLFCVNFFLIETFFHIFHFVVDDKSTYTRTGFYSHYSAYFNCLISLYFSANHTHSELFYKYSICQPQTHSSQSNSSNKNTRNFFSFFLLLLKNNAQNCTFDLIAIDSLEPKSNIRKKKMHRVLSYQTAMQINDDRNIHAYITKRTCISLIFSVSFFTLIIGMNESFLHFHHLHQ